MATKFKQQSAKVALNSVLCKKSRNQILTKNAKILQKISKKCTDFSYVEKYKNFRLL